MNINNKTDACILNTLDKELKVEEEQNNVLVVELNNVLA